MSITALPWRTRASDSGLSSPYRRDATNSRSHCSLLAATDTALETVETQLQRAKTLAVQANSDTVTPEGRAAILKDVQAIIADLLGVANTKDSRGQPLFGGAAGPVASSPWAIPCGPALVMACIAVFVASLLVGKLWLNKPAKAA